MQASKSVLIMAAGTGGHIFPALACAKEFMRRGYRVYWLGAGRPLEQRVVTAAGIELHNIYEAGLRSKGVLGLVKESWQLMRSFFQARKLIKRIKPVCVLGMGGYVSGPGGLAARSCAVPLVIHEQNAVAGTANRSLAKFAARVCQAFPGTFAEQQNLLTTGNPLREEILQLHQPKEQANQPVRLLVLGGSLGAEAINKLVPQALALLAADIRPQVKHQTGDAHHQITQQRYQEAGVTAEVVPFIDDMASAYLWADLVICRAGALTISELSAVGRGAFLIPLPNAIDDHQSKNAEFLASHEAALILKQQTTDAKQLAASLTEVLVNSDKLIAMGQQARRLSRPAATSQVVETCLEVANG